MASAVPIEEALKQASDMAGWLHEQLWEYAVPASARNRLAAACFAMVQEHHDAIATLVEKRLLSSAFALVRVLFEAYARGAWLANCATERDVTAFLKDKDPPSVAQQLQALEAAGLGDGQLLGIKARSWKVMNSYTHTGMMQVGRWNTPEGIEPSFHDDEIIEALQFAGAIMFLSGLGMAALSQDLTLSERILDKSKEWATARGPDGN